MHTTAKKQKKYYLSDKLQEQLEQISQYPLTVVEAPGGFGKTTAVREYLRSARPQAACKWYTCLGEPVAGAWNGICMLLAAINGEATEALRSLKAPTKEVLPCVADRLQRLNCREETYLIIDNYHLMPFDLHHELISAFSMHGNPNLHMIIITQQVDSGRQFLVHNDNICTIDALPFFFDREGIAGLFRMEGFRLTEEELEGVFARTEGWISAVRLEMINYRKTGALVGLAGIDQLVETAIWNRLAPKEKDFLLAVSVFDSFTAVQATQMLDHEVLPGQVEAKLKTNEFIRFLPDKGLFVIHGILLDYLRNQFYYNQPQEYQDRLFHKAGRCCAAMGTYCIAAKFFYKVGDFDAILSLPFTPQYLDAQKESCDDALFVAAIRECPAELLCAHPATMVAFAHFVMLNGYYDLYDKLCGLLRTLIEGETALSQQERQRITGELLLLESLGNFDLSKMRESYAVASALLKESPEPVEAGIPWLSVFPTAFGLFWHKLGGLDEELHTIDAFKPTYRAFNRGQGAGLSHLIAAEVMLTRGEDDEAEILCHKALYEARAHRQISICIHAELCLARVFVLRGDAERFFTAMGNIKKYAAPPANAATCRMVDLCLSILSLLLGVKDDVAPWLYDMEDIRRLLYVPVVPFAEILNFRLLLIDKRYNELYAVSQIALDALQSPDSKLKYLLPQVYCLIFMAVAKYNSGNEFEARRYLKEALDIALPDRVYLPFADHVCMPDLLSGLDARCFKAETPAPAREGAFDDPAISRPGAIEGIFAQPASRGDSLAALRALCKRQASGISMIQKAGIRNKSPLTPREREVASLAKARLSAKEIAAALYISERTVTTILRNVYSKLDIHSKNDLLYKEF